MVCVTGEPGIGKTSLVRRFLDDLDGGRVLFGTCDDLSIPRPLGPFRDLAGNVSTELAAALAADAAPHEIQDLLIAELERPPHPAVLVLEDVHWADHATLDSVTVLGRRIGALPGLLVVTYRGGEAPPGHPLHAALGAVRRDDVVLLELQPLSRDAVAALAGEDADDLYTATGGNPFYVTELLASRDGVDPPPSVASTVSARVARLDGPARRLVELVSAVPNRVSTSVLDELMPGWPVAAEEPERRQLLELAGGHVRFRHELARNAVLSGIPTVARRRVHAQVLGALRAAGADPADIVHHAEAAGDEDVVSEYALIAARRAAALESNREAYFHYRRAADFADRLARARAGGPARGAGHGRLPRRQARRRLRRDRGRDRHPPRPRRPGGGRALHPGAVAAALVRRRRRARAREGARGDNDPRAARRVDRARARLQRRRTARDARGGHGRGAQVGEAGGRPRDPAGRREHPRARAGEHRLHEGPAGSRGERRPARGARARRRGRRARGRDARARQPRLRPDVVGDAGGRAPLRRAGRRLRRAATRCTRTSRTSRRRSPGCGSGAATGRRRSARRGPRFSEASPSSSCTRGRSWPSSRCAGGTRTRASAWRSWPSTPSSPASRSGSNPSSSSRRSWR